MRSEGISSLVHLHSTRLPAQRCRKPESILQQEMGPGSPCGTGSWPRDQDTARAESFKLNRRYRHELPQSTGWRQRVQGKGSGKNDPAAHTLLLLQKTLELKGGRWGWSV